MQFSCLLFFVLVNFALVFFLDFEEFFFEGFHLADVALTHGLVFSLEALILLFELLLEEGNMLF